MVDEPCAEATVDDSVGLMFKVQSSIYAQKNIGGLLYRDIVAVAVAVAVAVTVYL